MLGQLNLEKASVIALLEDPDPPCLDGSHDTPTILSHKRILHPLFAREVIKANGNMDDAVDAMCKELELPRDTVVQYIRDCKRAAQAAEQEEPPATVEIPLEDLEAECSRRKSLAWQTIRRMSPQRNYQSYFTLVEEARRLLHLVHGEHGWFDQTTFEKDLQFVCSFGWGKFWAGGIGDLLAYVVAGVIRRQLRRERGLSPSEFDNGGR